MLQGLPYENKKFKRWLGVQRGALASSDDTAINNSVQSMQHGLSDPPDRLVLEDYQKRMDWIQTAATKYDGLMQGPKRQVMLDYLGTIKSWGDRPDT
ncbi:hypothetical protein K8353_09225 [Burkholderia contaminans]|nr:hypothetical protein [Burkholderia contaminans]